MQRTETLLAALFLGIAFAPHSGATVYHSDGSDANVQAIHDTKAHDGDMITLPAGTFTWTTGINLTKGITVSGQTTITGAGTANCTANDQTIIVDERPRGTPRQGSDRRRPRYDESHRRGSSRAATLQHGFVGRVRGTGTTAGGLFKATISAGKSFRLTGITFRRGTITQIGSGGAVRYRSTGLVTNARIDHCHFDHLNWGFAIQIGGWIYGVEDHNLMECVGAGIGRHIDHSIWGGGRAGSGSWADFPYFGSEKFWFVEDNTTKGSGTANTSGGTDAFEGGRYVLRHNYIQNSSAGGHGTVGGQVGAHGIRENQVYNNTFNWTSDHGIHYQRSGITIWHDNTFTGRTWGPPHAHTALMDYRQFGNSGLAGWGMADGENGWDNNDPHGVYLSGTAASNTTNHTFTTETIMAPDEFKGMQVRNDNPAAACYLKSSFIKGNTVTTITYAMGDAGPRLLFNTGDAFSIRKPLITVDQCGRGKGDLVSAGKQPRHWPNQQQETCFSWNDVHTDGTAIGLTSNMPTIHQGSDYINLGKGFPANTIPAQVQAAYPASVNGVAYTQEYPYPHPLTSGSPIPTPTATPTPTPTATATATATSTPTVTVTATATHTFHRASRRDQYTDAEHVVYTVADALNPNANLSNAPIF